jgi:hypothetical protein
MLMHCYGTTALLNADTTLLCMSHVLCINAILHCSSGAGTGSTALTRSGSALRYGYITNTLYASYYFHLVLE